LESIENGVDVSLIAPRVQQLHLDRQRLQASLGGQTGWRKLTAKEIRAWADELGGLVRILGQATPKQRASVYAELGLKLVYYPGSLDRAAPPRVKATADLARVGRGVGGGT
jgi:site-specific DNA recombinase